MLDALLNLTSASTQKGRKTIFHRLPCNTLLMLYVLWLCDLSQTQVHFIKMAAWIDLVFTCWSRLHLS